MNRKGAGVTGPFLLPGHVTFDMALSRIFHFRESQRLEFRTEAYNVTNSFPPGCAQGLGTTGPTGGVNTTVSINVFGLTRNSMEPRILQFALKYAF